MNNGSSIIKTQTNPFITKGLFSHDLNGNGLRLICQDTMFQDVINILSSIDKEMEDKRGLIQILIDVFAKVPWNVNIATNDYELVSALINQLITTTDQTYLDLLRQCMNRILDVIDIKREHIDTIYQSLSIHFRNNTIDHDILLNHLKGLSTLYGDNSQQKRPRSYLYFNGSGYIVVPCQTSLKIKEGFAISIWFNITFDRSMMIVNNNNRLSKDLNLDKEKTVLIDIKCENGQKLSVVLNNMELSVITSITEEPLLCLNADQWIHFSCIVEPKKNKSSSFTYIFQYSSPDTTINTQNTLSTSSTSLSSGSISKTVEIKGFNCSNNIIAITLFQNFIGKATSMLFMDKKIQTEAIAHMAQFFPFGFYKGKKVSQFIQIANNNYHNSGQKNTIESISPKTSSSTITSTNKKLNYLYMIYSQLKLFYVPFQYRKSFLEDICGNINAQICYNSAPKKGGDDPWDFMDYISVCNPSSIYKNISFLGGINALLPIAEELVKSTDSLLSDDILQNYLRIILVIINKKKKKNIANAFNENFFESLSIFLEKYPSHFFTDNILKIIKEIGEQMTLSSDNTQTAEIFFSYILFNEKIIKKFSEENQVNLWNFITNCLMDFSHFIFLQNKEFLSIGKICSLLRYYDQNHLISYCCKYHAEMFNNKSNYDIPDVQSKTGKLIQIAESQLTESENIHMHLVTIMKCLSLDISPCLQKGIIGLMKRVFLNDKISKTKRVKALQHMLYEKLLDILMYSLSLAMFDVRVDIMSFIVILMKNYKETYEINLLKKDFLYFLEDNVFPSNLIICLEGNLLKFNNLYDGIDNENLNDNFTLNDNKHQELETEAEQQLRLCGIYKEFKTPNKNTSRQANRRNTSDFKTLNTLSPDSLAKVCSTFKPPTPTSSSSSSNKQYQRAYAKAQTSIHEAVKGISLIQNPFITNDSNIINDQSRQSSLIKSTTQKYSLINSSSQFCPLDKDTQEQISSRQRGSTFIPRSASSSYQTKDNELFYEHHYNQLKKIYADSTQNIVSFIKDHTLSLLTNQMLNVLCEWLITSETKIDHEYVIDIILKLLFYSEMSHIETFLHILHDLIKKDEANIDKLLSNHKFYYWLIEVLFQSYLIVFQSNSREYVSLLKCSSIEKREKHAKQLCDLALIFHSVLIVKSPQRNDKPDSEWIEKLHDILLIGSKLKQKYNNTKKFNEVINKFIRSILLDALKYASHCLSSISTIMSNDSNNNKQEEKEGYYQKLGTILSIAFEFMLMYNIEHKGNLSNEYTIEKNIFPNFLFSGMNLNHDGIHSNPFNNNKSQSQLTLEIIWDDYILHKEILQIYSPSWLVNDLNETLEELVTKRKIIEKYNESISLLLINKGHISIVKILSGMYMISIILTQDTNEKAKLLNDYCNFIMFIIVISTTLSSQSDNYQYASDEFLETIAYSIIFLYEESSQNDLLKQSYLTVINAIFSSIIKILYYANKQANKKKKQFIKNFLTTKSKKKIDLNKCPIVKLFNEYITEIKPIGTREIIFDSKIIELLYKDFNHKNSNQYIHEKARNAFVQNIDLRNRVKDFFGINGYEKSCNMRIFNIKRYHFIYGKETNINDFYSYSHFKDKCRLTEIIHDISKFYTDEIIKCSIEEDHMTKLSIKYYQKAKKKLYTWKGLWSNRRIYYEEASLLKLKVINHYGNNLLRPLLSPIIDIDYYLPDFSNFDKKTLFLNDTKDSQSTSLDIHSLLHNVFCIHKPRNDPKKPEESSDSNDNESKSSGSNQVIILSSINYMFSYPELTGVYEEIGKLSTDRISKQINLRNNKMYHCCYVKTSHHIKGLLEINESSIVFIVNEWDNRNDEDYDEERKACIGSTFVKHRKDRDIISIEIPLKEVRYIFKRTYFYKKSSIELFTTNNKSYFFNFPTANIRTKIINDLIAKIEFRREIKAEVKDKTDDIIGYEVLENKKSNKSDSGNLLKVEQWQNWKMSTFDFLLWLNICANRSFSDILQYPVFPWILSQYHKKKLEINEENIKDLRDLRLPMGMMELNEQGAKRKNEYIEKYNSMKIERANNPSMQQHSIMEEDDLYFYGSHYSNPIYVSHYLMRIFPFANILIELQGNKFDDPNRLFLSIEKSFNCATSQKVDVRELCPEFYYLPEMFLNINDLELGMKIPEGSTSIEKKDMCNVILPQWSENNPYYFIIQMKENLESSFVCNNMNKWIDLIFGYKQRGKEGENAQNIFIRSSYEDFNIDQLDKDQRFYYIRLADFGLTPHQLFFKELPNRKKLDSITFGKYGKQLTQSANLRFYSNKGNKSHEKGLIMLKMKALDNDKVIGVFNNNQYIQYKFTYISQDSKYQTDQSTKKYISQQDSFLSSKINDYYSECNYNCPMVIYSNGKHIAQAGYWNGRVAIFHNDNNVAKVNYIENPYDSSPVVVLIIDKEERMGFAGSINGSVTLYKVNEFYWEIHKILCDHSQEITSISVSNNLNMFASCAKDGYVMLYTLPLGKLVRSIKIKDNVYGDQVFLSSSPLASFVVYSQEASLFYCYSINGCFLCASDEEHEGVLSAVTFSDYSFNDFLAYGTHDGYFKMRAFPNMIQMTELQISSQSVKCLDVTEDRVCCYAWINDGQDLVIIKDPTVIETAQLYLYPGGFY